MAILKILTAPHPILSKRAENVEIIDDNIRLIIRNMLDTMHSQPSVGLAANQVGILKRIIVLDLQDDDNEEHPKDFYPLCMINPEIIYKSKDKFCAPEGCLSLADVRLDVERPRSIVVRYMDISGKVSEVSSSGWLSKVVQHEVDHLDGILALDHVSSLKKAMALKKIKKSQREMKKY